MIGSRLAERITPATVTIIQDGGTLSAGLSETEVQATIKAWYAERQVTEQSGPFNEPSTRLVDVFTFDGAVLGTLPTVKEGYVIRWNSIDYTVTTARNLGGRSARLEVHTHRIRP